MFIKLIFSTILYGLVLYSASHQISLAAQWFGGFSPKGIAKHIVPEGEAPL
jgi:hypothetical protein